VEATDIFGCKNISCKTLNLDPYCEECDIFIPNAFSPNRDGNNDVLYVRSQCIKDIHFVIYDRWGEKLFETTDLSVGWDGLFKGESMNPAVYTYYLEALHIQSGKKIIRKGNVSLVK
jgi:gliding motility-associated-like protein